MPEAVEVVDSCPDLKSSNWYKDGLRFECQRCGCCCRIRGVVWVTPEEITRISSYLGMEEADFMELYIRKVDGRPSLRERKNGDCCLFNPKIRGCEAYDVRPKQCSSYPFWPRILVSKASWMRQASNCPGLNKGRVWTEDEILKGISRYRSIRQL